MVADRLTDYQIAQCFGDTLSLIYKDKMQELNDDLQDVFNHLDSLAIPQVSEFHRWFAAETIPTWAKEKFRAIEHIQKIRRLYRRIKSMPDGKGLDVEKAKAVPIIDVLGVAIKRGSMACCPFHKDDYPSMKINKNNTAKCFGCSWYGDSIKAFMAINKVGFKEAVLGLGKM